MKLASAFVLAMLGASSVPTLAGDWSVNAAPVSTSPPLQTIPPMANRNMIEIQAQCPGELTVVLDDIDERGRPTTSTTFRVAGAAAGSSVGGEYWSTAHTGRVRVFSANAACPVAIREWP